MNNAEFLGAYAALPHIGREELLNEIKSVLVEDTKQSQLILLTADGGYGKTRLLQTLLDQLRDNMPGCSSRLVDLYHTETHTRNGLISGIVSALEPESGLKLEFESNLEFGDEQKFVDMSFPRYQSAFKRLNTMRLVGEVVGAGEQQERMIDEFKEDLRQITKEQRVIIALDTAERLLYNNFLDSGSSVQPAAVWNWLLELLNEFKNVSILVAGRPEIAVLEPLTTKKFSFISFEVKPFNEAESKRYLGAAIAAARAAGNELTAARLENLEIDQIDTLIGLANGRPILLSLMVDLAAAYDEWPLSQAMLTETDMEEIEALLINTLITPRIGSRLGPTILALGRLPKGATPELLAHVLGISVGEARDRLTEVQHLSFVKIRPRDQRVFLHDVMYEMLHRHVYNLPGDAPDKKQAYQVILEEYERQLTAVHNDINKLFEPLEFGVKESIDRNKLEQLGNERLTLMSETLFYHLRYRPVRGFVRWYNYTLIALANGDALLDRELDLVLLEFWHEQDPHNNEDQIRGLPRDIVRGTSLGRRVALAFAEERYQDAINEAHNIRAKHTEFAPDRERLTPSALDVWEARSLVYLGGADELQQADNLLTGAIDALETYIAGLDIDLADSTDDSAEYLYSWRAHANLALAYGQRGYANRIRNNLQAAVADYRHSATIWHQLDVLVELGTTQNNLGFAYNEQNLIDEALDMVDNALATRKQLAAWNAIGLTHNTRGLIEMFEGRYRDAMDHSNLALAIFRALDSRRGTGLALTALAEITRRHSASNAVLAPERKIELLHRSLHMAEDANLIFRESKENVRRFAALVEVGCAYRDWIGIRVEHPDPRDDRQRLLQKAQISFEQALQLANQSAVKRRQLEVLVNIVALGHVAQNNQLFEQSYRRAEEFIPDGYRIDPQLGRPSQSTDTAENSFWPLVATLHLLNGHHEMDQIDVSSDCLASAAEQYTLCLQYNELFDDDFRDLRRATSEIHARLNQLSSHQLRMFTHAVLATEHDYHIGSSVLKERLKRRALWLE